MIHRPAKLSECAALNTLIRESKGFWPYSDGFIDQFMQQWGINESYLQTNEIILFEKEEHVIGLFSFKMNHDNKPELDLFFVNRNHIGKGIGKSIWQQALNYALDHDWTEFQIIADPNAEGFYQHMGAKTIGSFESFPGRFVPMMLWKK